ncbi:class F sortase [Uniformispora flossi]|uniref:class F sortase n=1 Tax=Uniformispora flossi TaxID=3390723 RepID=UPI003C2FE006
MSDAQPKRTGRTKMVAVAAGAVFLGVCAIQNDLKSESGPPQPAAAQASPSASASPAASAAASAKPSASPSPTKPASLGSSPPLRIRIGTIGVDAPFVGLGLNANGILDVPSATNRNLAGWYEDGVTPGARGNAIVLGHVDTKLGPAVFWGLGSLKAGDEVAIDRADGKTAKFSVDSVESFPKNAFPDDRVYGKTPDAQLRLITCGGVYDKKRKDYLDNVVVFAHYTGAS